MNDKKKTLLTRSDLNAMGITYSNSHLLELERIGAFPERIYLSKQKVCWDLSEVEAWLDQKRSRRGGSRND